MSVNQLAANIFQDLIGELFDRKVMGNLYRPHYVERLVVKGLGEGFSLTSADWSGWDIEHSCGVRIEVKQSAALQTWTGRESVNGRTTPGSFDIAPRTGYFDGGSTLWVKHPGRPAQIYIFAWHPITELDVCDQRDPAQWRFFVTPACELPEKQKTISRRVVETRWSAVGFDELRNALLGAIDALKHSHPISGSEGSLL
ncbi:hypothetical protein [Methylocystis echinoides]|uniref:Restriction endonuclease n=1 Tax=Methylocystis echinoides TaxID=29468 RepID=A0A9W6LQF0_9HYPH|nr:hypothetical protein [Methylocystis echinoides]GLI91475.1 hypothetical protein LMG27198_04670 [Methylocystis echinoides]